MKEAKIAPFIDTKFLVTGAYGEKRSDHIHKGVDLATGSKSPVYALKSGSVILSKIGDGYGRYVIVRSRSGSSFLYGDLDDTVYVNVGDVIEEGQQIGNAGNPSGTTSTGLHVHIEMQDITNHSWNYNWNSGYFENPCDFMGINNIVSYSQYYIYKKQENSRKTVLLHIYLD